MLRHGRLRDAEPFRRSPDGRRAGDEALHDRSADRVREREEAAIEFRLIVHQGVNYSWNRASPLRLLHEALAGGGDERDRLREEDAHRVAEGEGLGV